MWLHNSPLGYKLVDQLLCVLLFSLARRPESTLSAVCTSDVRVSLWNSHWNRHDDIIRDWDTRQALVMDGVLLEALSERILLRGTGSVSEEQVSRSRDVWIYHTHVFNSGCTQSCDAWVDWLVGLLLLFLGDFHQVGLNLYLAGSFKLWWSRTLGDLSSLWGPGTLESAHLQAFVNADAVIEGASRTHVAF